MIEEYFNSLLHMVRCLHCILVLHDFAGRYFSVASADPTHKLHKRLVGVYHDKLFFSLQLLVIDCCYHNFLQDVVHVDDQMITVEIILVLLIHDRHVAVCRVDQIGWCATWFSSCKFSSPLQRLKKSYLLTY